MGRHCETHGNTHGVNVMYLITPIDQVITYLVCMNGFYGFLPIEGNSPAEHEMKLEFDEYQLEFIHNIEMHPIIIGVEAPERPVVTLDEPSETQVSKTRKPGQIPETGRVDEVI